MKRLELLSPASFSALLPAAIAALFCAITGIGLLTASAWLIASAALHPPLYTLALGITAVRACGISRAVFRYAERYLTHRLAFHALTTLRVRLYGRAAALLPLRALRARQGEVLHDMLTGADERRDFFVRGLLPPITACLLTLGILAWLTAVIGTAALILLVPFTARLSAPVLVWHLSQPDTREPDSAYRSALLDLGDGADELRFAGTRSALTVLKQAAAAKQRADEKAARRADGVDTALEVLDAIVWLLVLAALIPAVEDGRMSGIAFAAAFLTLEALFSELQPTAEAVRQICRSHRAARASDTWGSAPAQALPGSQNVPRPQTSETMPPQPRRNASFLPVLSASSVSGTLLAARDVSFGYRPGQTVLSHLSFSVQPGEHLTIFGASGAGKTTLAELLLGVWPPDSGELYLGGKPYRECSREMLCASISGMPQGSVLFSASIRENFQSFCPETRDAEIEAALRVAQLAPVIGAMPQGIDTPIGPDAAFLSGGQRSRLLTALTLARRTPLVLLDEPTCGLDDKTASALFCALFAHARETGQTLLIITHDAEVLSSTSLPYRSLSL